MLQITTHTSENFPPQVAEFCSLWLCRQGSEMQAAFRDIAAGDEPAVGVMEISVATRLVDDEPVPIGWASISTWEGLPAVQGSVFPQYRRRGMASALVSALTVAGELPLAECHVFSPHFVSIAKRAGFQKVNEWKLVEDGWIKQSES